jgi:hypothetical protein
MMPAVSSSRRYESMLIMHIGRTRPVNGEKQGPLFNRNRGDDRNDNPSVEAHPVFMFFRMMCYLNDYFLDKTDHQQPVEPA